jgi:acetyl-CoA synthetase
VSAPGAVPADRSEVAWVPDPGAFAASPVGRMAARLGVDDVDTLAARAIANPDWFWAAAAADVGLRWMTPYNQVLDRSDGDAFPHFFAGGRLNWSDYTVDRWVDAGAGDREAIWWEGDDGARRRFTYAELQAEVNRAAGAFRALGVGEGDVIAMLLPMVPEAVVTLLAGARIGAIVAPMFSGFGPNPVALRLADSAAGLLVTADAFPRRGRRVALLEVARAARRDAPVAHTLVVPRASGDTALEEGEHWWHDALAGAEPVDRAVPMDAEAPCLLLYTSGSTGQPKGCVHTHAGLPFKFAQEARHSMGVDEHHRVLWLTDMGWVMGAWLTTAALTNGATAILFEGVPDHPTPDRLWSVAEHSRATVLGIAPTVVRALMGHGDEWVRDHTFPDLQVIGSTGEPWNPDPWWWAFRMIGRSTLPIVNFSGGTECGASIVSNTIYQPIKPGGFRGPQWAMGAEVVDDDGRPVRGRVGELVVRGPWPGMTRSLWSSPGRLSSPARWEGRERYLDTYWSRFEGLWLQGDFAIIDEDGHWFLLGRSDDTIMLAGKRVGPAEIESVLVEDPDVIEAAAVGVPHDVKGEVLVCFAVLAGGADEAAVLRRLPDALVRAEGPTVRPKAVHAVPALPKTRNGKVMRRVARAAYLGLDPGDLTALDNAEAIEAFGDLTAGASA